MYEEKARILVGIANMGLSKKVKSPRTDQLLLYQSLIATKLLKRMFFSHSNTCCGSSTKEFKMVFIDLLLDPER